MESSNLDWKSRPERTLERRGLRAKAPVAAHYEDCFQALLWLCSFLDANRADAKQAAANALIAENCMGRLRSWGGDSGASSRVLDYALKVSSKPRRQTLRLLSELDTAIAYGKWRHSPDR
jgi:hypothetical protein